MRFYNLNMIVILMSLLVSGCAQLNSDFDCPMKDGVRCMSIHQVNEAVDRGALGDEPANITVIQPSYLQGDYIQYKDGRASLSSPIRKPEEVTHVWVAPYEDVNGNYHQASNVYTVSRPGFWRGNPPKAIKGE